MHQPMRKILYTGLIAALLVLPAATVEARPGKNKIQTWMLNTGADPDAKGLAKLFTNGKRDRFTVKVKGLDVGTYDVMMDGALMASFDVAEDLDGKTSGKVRFDEKKGNPLTFDPKGTTIDVMQGETTYLTCDFPATQEEVMHLRLHVDLVNSGAILGAEGEADYRLHKGKMRFDVRIEDVPEGDYDLRVDGASVGTITAVLDGTDVDGELNFSTHGDHGDDLPMTFDPRGKMVEVVDMSTDLETVILSVEFPMAASSE